MIQEHTASPNISSRLEEQFSTTGRGAKIKTKLEFCNRDSQKPDLSIDPQIREEDTGKGTWLKDLLDKQRSGKNSDLTKEEKDGRVFKNHFKIRQGPTITTRTQAKERLQSMNTVRKGLSYTRSKSGQEIPKEDVRAKEKLPCIETNPSSKS